MKICFIGYGNMAKAIANGLKRDKQIELHACSPSLDDGTTIDGVHGHNDNNAVISDMDVVILAVKPHQIQSVLPSLNLSPKTVLVSVAAGVTLAQLAKLAPNNQAIVRSMPNTPLAVGVGATQLMANDDCSPNQKHHVETLFSSSGIFIWLDEESLIDSYTGLSGSGPAYVFYILEAMIDGAMQLGIDADNARRYAEQTLLGAIKLGQESQLPYETLRRQVTSPGGATAEAINIFDKNQLRDIIRDAMAASCHKAKQLKESVQ